MQRRQQPVLPKGIMSQGSHSTENRGQAEGTLSTPAPHTNTNREPAIPHK